jgi:aminobenzoyl-glutamate transport protein
MFALLAVLVLIASWIASRLGVAVIHPKDGSTIQAVNLLDTAGIRRIFTEAVRNFTGFAPLGTVLVAMIGIGVAEASGLVQSSLRGFVMSVPRALLTATVVFAGVNANLAADAGIIVLPPIAAMLFAAVGRHPLAGIAAAFAGVSGGFSANLLPSTLDVLLAGFSQEALDASKLLPDYRVQLLGNYWFMVVATPLLTVAGTWVTHRFVEPRLGPWPPPREDGEGARARATREESRAGGASGPARAAADSTVTPGAPASGSLAPLSAGERRGLIAALVALVATLVVMAALTLPAGAPLRAEGRTWIEQLKPFFDSMVVWVLVVFLVPGVAYGIATGTIRSDRDVAGMAGRTLATMGTYIVLAFAAAQFVSYFAWSNLGAILAISGADLLRHLGLQGGMLIVGFVVLSAFINLFIASATAKWAVMAPVFVPMFVLLGFTPEGTQAVFRIGDSCTNIVTPLMPYMPFILTCAAGYVPKAGSGTIVAMMIPYSIVFLVLWTALLLVFYALGWPIGPGVGMRLG